MSRSRIVLLLAIGIAMVAFFALDLDAYFTLESYQRHRQMLETWYQSHTWQTVTTYFVIYVVMTALSFPGATVISLVGGALFGLWLGTLVVSFASTIGATLAFLVARYLARDSIERRFGQRIRGFNREIERQGAYYLFTLRLVPLFPFFVINLACGLTRLRVGTFYWVSQIGMLPGTLVFINAGTQLGQVERLDDLFTPTLIASFALLGLFPLLIRKLLDAVNARKVYRRYTRPERYDRNLVVIGAGAGGLVSSYIAAAVEAKVSLIEKHRMGGDCLYTGCVPSKALIHAARHAHTARNGQHIGITTGTVTVDFARVMQRVHDVIDDIEPHDSAARYRDLGVECVSGSATIVSPWEVEVGGQRLRTRNIIIATGSRPALPDIKGLDSVDALTTDSVWSLQTQPERLLILGAGAVACELAQAFQRLGTQCTLVARGDRLLKHEDIEVSTLVAEALLADGVDLRLAHTPVSFAADQLRCRHNGNDVALAFDQVLLATGRTPVTDGLGLAALDLELAADGGLVVDEYLRTRFPNIFAVGDVTGPYRFTHAAAHQAWYATVNALFGGFRKVRVGYSALPHATFTDPEVAGVGINEQQALAQHIAYEVTRFELAELDRAIIDATTAGSVKVLTVPGTDRILGATIVGPHAGELINEFTLAMRHRLGLNKLLGVVRAYPTLNEANKYAAGVWKRTHAPLMLLRLAAWLHRRKLS